MPLLEMRAIVKRFGGVTALENVSIDVDAAEVVALIGENGAGKSTMMKVLGGVHTPDSGQIVIDGAPVTIRDAKQASRLGITFIHQELSVLDNLDVAGNVFLGREPTKGPLKLMDTAAMRAATTGFLKQVGLTGVRPDMSVADLSLAQRQMVEIARALSQEARIIIMDEPTSSLTPHETERLLELIRELRDERGVSTIYISHRLNEIQEIANRAIALRDGKNAGQLTREELVGREGRDRMVRMMVGRNLAVAQEKAAEDAATTTEDRRPRLTIRNLQTTRYPAKSVSFDIQPGEVLGMAGLVGAGRTEVAEAIFGVAPALSGELLLDGQPIRVGSARDGIDNKIYLVPEDRRRCGLILSLPIGENITLPALAKFATPSPWGWIRRGAEQEVAAQSLSQLNVKSAAGRAAMAGNSSVADAVLPMPASNLSGGNQQKVVLARWLSLGPKVMLFDEPTRGVDVGAKAEIYDLIRTLAHQGVAVLLISSDMEEVLSLSDRLAVMHEGTITGILQNRADFGEENVMRLATGERLPTDTDRKARATNA